MRAVDTNVLVRLVVGDNPSQTAAAEEYISKGAWISTLVLAETLWVLDRVYKRTMGSIADTVTMLLQSSLVTLEAPDVVADALLLFHAKPSVSPADCLILELARHAGHLPLGTFDRKLARLDGAERIG